MKENIETKVTGQVAIRVDGKPIYENHNDVSSSWANYISRALGESDYKLNTLHFLLTGTPIHTEVIPAVTYPAGNAVRFVWEFIVAGSNLHCDGLKMSAGTIGEYFSTFAGFDNTFLIGQTVTITWDLTFN